MAVAVNIEAPRIIVRRTVSTTAAIPKGTLLKFDSSPNTVAATGAQNDLFAGIAVEEKVTTETDITNIGVALDGVWDIDTTSAAINANFD